MSLQKAKLVYEIKWLIELVYKESDKLLHRISDTTIFEERCIRDLGEYLALDKDNKNNKNYLVRLVKRKVKEAVTSYRKEEAELASELYINDEEGNETEFEPIDVLADVESEIIKKETADLLAQGDCRKEKIIELWVTGYSNNALISRMLAHSFGGNEEAHRKYIQRFRQSCRKKLAAAI